MQDLSSRIDRVQKADMVINREYEAFLRDVRLDSFAAVWQCPQGETVKKIKPRSVTRLSVANGQQTKSLYAKRHNREFIGPARLLGRFFRRKGLSQGLLEFDNICRFRESGIATVTPVAAGEKRTGLFRVESFVLTEDFSPYVSLESLLAKSPGFFQGRRGALRKRILLNEAAGLARKMHGSGFHHRDFNATHILLDYGSGAEVPRLALFDLQRVEKGAVFRFRWKIKGLARLNYSLPEAV
ncbi:MAG TPA: lipopolysaccharide kinase InaA family protein, partial [Desulfosalsimonadaceae bacterium]|nr:lipopolysaccharide kinase InaA family protein [Desulfosalsimonadaceae bacterium]